MASDEFCVKKKRARLAGSKRDPEWSKRRRLSIARGSRYLAQRRQPFQFVKV